MNEINLQQTSRSGDVSWATGVVFFYIGAVSGQILTLFTKEISFVGGT
jgi:hypothetical protein